MDHRITDTGNSRKYFTQIPHLVDDLDLSVYAYRLYGHLKRVAGEDGKCWRSTRTLSKDCNISMGKISDAKRELEENELIKIVEEKTKRGGKNSHVITIIDIWPENMNKYKSSSPDELASSGDERASSPGEIKNNPLRRTREEEGDSPQTPKTREQKTIAKITSLFGGSVNPTLLDQVNDWFENYPLGWIEDAIETARENGASHPNYISKVLANRYNGNGSRRKSTPHDRSKAAIKEAERRMMERGEME